MSQQSCCELPPNAFDTIKEILRITDVLTLYGVEVLRNNKALCPLHNEKTPVSQFIQTVTRGIVLAAVLEGRL